MFVIQTSRGLYTVFGYDIYNDAAQQILGTGYRVGIERTRVSELLVMQNPILYLFPFAFNIQAYVDRAKVLLNAIEEGLKNNPGVDTIWEYIEALVMDRSLDTQGFLQEKVYMLTSTLTRDLNKAEDILRINRRVIVDYELLDLLTTTLNNVASKSLPAFLTDIGGLHISDGITNTVTQLDLESQIERFMSGVQGRFAGIRGLGLLKHALTLLKGIIGSEEVAADILHEQYGHIYNITTQTDKHTAEINIKQKATTDVKTQTNSGYVVNQETQNNEDIGALERLATLIYAKRIELPRRWADTQRQATHNITLTFSANNIFEYVTDILSPILLLQCMSAPTQSSNWLLPFLIGSPPGVMAVIPGKTFVPFGLIETFQYTLDPIHNTNTGHSLNATVQLSITNLLGAFVTPRTPHEDKKPSTPDIFNTALSAIIGSLIQDPIKVALYNKAQWISKPDESKYSSGEHLLYGDNLYYRSDKRTLAQQDTLPDTQAGQNNIAQASDQQKLVAVSPPNTPLDYAIKITAPIDQDKIRISDNCYVTVGQIRTAIYDTLKEFRDSVLTQIYQEIEPIIGAENATQFINQTIATQLDSQLNIIAHELYLTYRAKVDTLYPENLDNLSNTPLSDAVKEAIQSGAISFDELRNVLIAISRHESGMYKYDIGLVDKDDRGYMQVNLRYHGDKIQAWTNVDPDLALRSDRTLGAEIGYRIYLQNLDLHLRAYNVDPAAYDIGMLALPYHRPAERNYAHPYAIAIRRMVSTEPTISISATYQTEVDGEPRTVEINKTFTASELTSKLLPAVHERLLKQCQA